MSDATPRRAVFLDFDGTITAQDTFVRVVRQFAPDESAAVLPGIVSGAVTLRDGIRRIVESIPSTQLPAMLDSIADVPSRAGLPELLDFLDSAGAPAYVVSSGLVGLVKRHLGSMTDRFAGIFAPDVDTSGERLKLHCDYESGDELIAKANVMAHHFADDSVAVGDSVTDRSMARAANLVFARDHLIGYCEREGIAFTPWNDFHDVRRVLEDRWRQ